MATERIVWTSLIVLAIVVKLPAQAIGPVFEVASVKRLPRPAAFSPTRTPPRSAAFYRGNTTVASLIQFAYGILDFQLVGGPDWVREDQFEVSARAASEVPIEQMQLMVRSLLQDRFQLVLRADQREMRFATLVLARDDGRLGPGLKECDENAPPTRIPLPAGARISSVRCGSMTDIANLAAAVLRIPIVEKTGLTGLWDHEITFLVEPSHSSTARAGTEPLSVDSSLAPFPTALQEQLGLTLETGRGPVDVLVIDSVRQPKAN